MNKDQFDGLAALKVVAQEKSFTIAAEKLHVSPPAVSKMISQLEKKMGVTLLTRTTRAVSLTEAGKTFLDIAGPAMDQIVSAQLNAQSFATKTTGTLKLNMPSVLFPYYMNKYIKTFLEKFPDVIIDIYGDDMATNIFENGFDAGVRTDDIIAKDLVAYKLAGPIKFLPVASPEYLAKNGTPKKPSDLLTHNCIRHRFGAGDSIYEKWEFEENGKEFAVNIQGNIILNTSEAIRTAALNGFGIAYTEYGNVAQDIKEKRLKPLLKKYCIDVTGYYLYYPSRKQVSPTLRAFIDHIKDSK